MMLGIVSCKLCFLEAIDRVLSIEIAILLGVHVFHHYYCVGLRLVLFS